MVPCNPDEYPGAECLQALLGAKPPEIVTFCPHMHSIDWARLWEPSEEAFQCMPLFMSPATEKVTFSLMDLKTIGLSLMQALFHNFPGLQHVEILGISTRQQTAVDKALSEMFSHGQALCSIRMSASLTQTIAESLTGLAHLNLLEAKLDDRSVFAQSSRFRALTSLEVRSETFRATSNFLCMLASPLETARFRLWEGVLEPDELTRTFEVMKLHCSHPHLSGLNIFTLDSRVEPPGSCINDGVLRPLLVFSNLSRLELHLTARTDISNSFLREMASAWPRLSTLVLNTTGWLQKSSITPAGLIPLLGLPCLTIISIAIDASIIDSTAQPAIDGTVTGALIHMMLQDSAVEDNNIRPMAIFLAKFAPNLKGIDSWNDDIAPSTNDSMEVRKKYRKRWEQIAHLVRDLIAASEQEKTEATAE